MTKLDYWLWLSLKEGIGQQKISHLLELFNSPEEIFKLSKQTLKTIEGLGKEEVRALSDKSMKRAAFVKEQCKRFGIRILTYDSEFYPQKLKEIADPPHVLYVLSKTRINLNDKLCIGMVGNRVMTEYGRCVAQDIATQLSKAGVVVVSGMARGIDGTAHTATLHSGGISVAVLGCGLDTAYPPEHDEMMEAICETGMVISEYPPGTPPAANHFPIRNRIISGLSDGIVVVEAPEKSGSLITADFALQQGRDVFAVPGDITRPHSVGTNNLIRQGATLVCSGLDILKEYEAVYRNILKQSTLQKEALQAPASKDTDFALPKDGRYDGLSVTAMKIVSKLSLTPVHFDVLLGQTALTADELSAELMMLEIGGFVKTLPGKHFVLNV